MAVGKHEDPNYTAPILAHKFNEGSRSESHIIPSWKENDRRSVSRIAPEELIGKDRWRQDPVMKPIDQARGVFGEAPALPPPYPGLARYARIEREKLVGGLQDVPDDYTHRLAEARRQHLRYDEDYVEPGAQAVPTVPTHIGIRALDGLGITFPAGETPEAWLHTSGDDADQPKYPISGLRPSRLFATAEGIVAVPDPKVWGDPNDPLTRITTHLFSENSEPYRRQAPLSEDSWQPREY